MLSVYLEPFEKAIAFQVTSQSPTITDFINRGGAFLASNGWKVTIQKGPELDVKNKVIYLRGSDSSLDLRVDRIWDIKDNYSRVMYITQIDKALNELVSTLASPFLYTAALAGSNPTSAVSGRNANILPIIN